MGSPLDAYRCSAQDIRLGNIPCDHIAVVTGAVMDTVTTSAGYPVFSLKVITQAQFGFLKYFSFFKRRGYSSSKNLTLIMVRMRSFCFMTTQKNTELRKRLIAHLILMLNLQVNSIM